MFKETVRSVEAQNLVILHIPYALLYGMINVRFSPGLMLYRKGQTGFNSMNTEYIVQISGFDILEKALVPSYMIVL